MARHVIHLRGRDRDMSSRLAWPTQGNCIQKNACGDREGWPICNGMEALDDYIGSRTRIIPL